jgi:hypothetical protein
MLPHLYGIEKYQWQIDFFESTNRYNFLTAANQIGKSSVQICKCIDWATNRDKWPELWQNKPTQYWYFYADATQATVEFHEKWVKEFLPKNEMKSHPDYGWRAEYDSRKKIHALHFNTGVSVYFKTYEQNVHSLQASTVFAVFADEEMPKHLFDEVNVRLIANRGYFHMVFTATRGQDFWRLTIEPKPGEKVNFPDAFKKQVSMYDCLFYANGQQSKWTTEYIKEIERSCSSEQEKLRRVYGRFVKSEGLLVNSFKREVHTTRDIDVPADWVWYSGVDCGNGGDKGHPPAIVFIAVRPDYKYCKVMQCWRGDDVAVSSAELLQKYISMKGNRSFRGEAYDYGGIGKDFGLLAERAGQGLMPAKKDREFGFGILNDLFQLNMCQIALLDSESEKLCIEINTSSKEQDKTHAKDDLLDAFRYAAVWIPFVMQRSEKVAAKAIPSTVIKSRWAAEEARVGLDALLDEFEEWNQDCEYLGY